MYLSTYFQSKSFCQQLIHKEQKGLFSFRLDGVVTNFLQYFFQQVEEKNGKTKKIKTKDSESFVITSSTWKINKKPSKHTDEAQYSEYFVRTAVLTNDKGGRKTENVKESESEDDGNIVEKDVFKMTDEQLFAACKGRTAHK